MGYTAGTGVATTLMKYSPLLEKIFTSAWKKYSPLSKIDQGSRDDWLLSHDEQQSGARQDNEATGKTSFVTTRWFPMNDAGDAFILYKDIQRRKSDFLLSL